MPIYRQPPRRARTETSDPRSASSRPDGEARGGRVLGLYATDEPGPLTQEGLRAKRAPKSQPGWIGAEMGSIVSTRALYLLAGVLACASGPEPGPAGAPA